MLTEPQKLWVQALRSGKYMQCHGVLGDVTGYCCFGVACEVAIENGIPVERGKNDDGLTFNGHKVHAPDHVVTWLGLVAVNGTFERGSLGGLHGPFGKDGRCCLTNENDRGATFEQIAAIIESEPEGLFVKSS